MATIQGSAGGGGRVPFLDVTVQSRTPTEAVLRFTFRSNPVSGYSTWGTFSGTLKINSSNYAVSGSVTSGVANTIWQRDITYNTAGAFTLNVSLTGSIPGASGWTSTSLSGSMSVPAGAAEPGEPSGFTFTRTSDTTLTIGFTKGSGATSTQLTASKNGAAWYNLAEPTGTTQNVAGVVVDSYWRFQAYSKNEAGNSAVVGPFVIYTKPAAPSKPTVGSAGKVSWANRARYTHGVEVQRTDNGGSTTTTVSLGAVASWTDPATQQPLTQYRVRSWAGPSADEDKTFSDWSDWSESAMAATYAPPKITAMTARRCNSAGVLTETGRYLRVTTSGTVSKVPNAAGSETNKLTRKVGYRKKGSTTWTETTVVNGGTPNNWTNSGITIGSNLISETEVWEVRATVQDAYSGLIVQQVTVPVSQVALSLGSAGVGAGKTWEQGALDVGGDAYVSGDLLVGGHPTAKQPILLTVPGVALAAGEATGGTVTAPTPAFPAGKGWLDYQPAYAVVGNNNTNTERFVVNVRSYTASGLVFATKKIASGEVPASDWKILVTLTPKF